MDEIKRLVLHRHDLPGMGRVGFGFGHGRDFPDSPGSGNFPQSQAKLAALSVRMKVGVRSRNGASLNFRSGAIRGDFHPV
jgi:hypothetical protein